MHCCRLLVIGSLSHRSKPVLLHQDEHIVLIKHQSIRSIDDHCCLSIRQCNTTVQRFRLDGCIRGRYLFGHVVINPLHACSILHRQNLEHNFRSVFTMVQPILQQAAYIGPGGREYAAIHYPVIELPVIL